MTVRAAWLTETGQTREDTRLTLSGLLTVNAGAAENVPLKARGGIVPGGFALTGAAGGMTCTIGTGRAFVQGGRINQGAYPVAVTEPETLTVTDGDALYDRIDLVELVVQDGVYDGTAESAAKVRLVQGTPAATPVAPNTPDGSALPLYRILVPKGRSAGTGGVDWASAVTSLRYPTVALGGIVPAGGFNGAYAGQYREESGVLQRWDGAAWAPYPRSVGGIAPASPLLATGSYVGQYREDAAGLLQRWNGSAWVYAEGRTTILFSASQTTQQSVASGVWAQITLNVVDVDDAAGWSGSNTYTVPRAGWWRLACAVSWFTESSAGSRGARLHLNGVGVPRATWQIGAGPGATSVGGTALLKLAAGDKIALHGLQSSNVTMTTLGGSGYSSNLTAEWLRS
ncbi:hypothetical protein OG562_25825 [Streptomyces sp. NBC_01275]|uniref:hypothetical protein n=1 Tax=Streptomyces sp. NBC_01275 TaxID=2903807 RepID=UPI00225B9063|nr:hypothetical protein [Streptomyces sp. NBC_01275]MCX4764317.1 hypothetical protein [Streptomyces sp. NBC_01275]